MRSDKMKIAISGYGTLSKALISQISKRDDFEIVAVFTRRDTRLLKPKEDITLVSFEKISEYKDKVDVMLNCMSSAYDLPVTTPYLASFFNQIDAFDMKESFSQHFARVDRYAKKGKKLTLIGCGWDPGLFSLFRVYMRAIVLNGKDYTFWGKGIRSGHCSAVRTLEEVEDAAVYTIPDFDAIESVKTFDDISLPHTKTHKKVCFVVLREGADKKRTEKLIKSMPEYFSPFDTVVHFVSEEEFKKEHSSKRQNARIITATNDEDELLAQFSLKMKCEPQFTANVFLAFAKAVYKLSRQGKIGCISVFDIAPGDLFDFENDDKFLLI